MANVAINVAHDGGLKAKFKSFGSAVARGYAAYVHSRSRIDQINAMNRKSDEELARLGITRDQIPAYVFRDLFYA